MNQQEPLRPKISIGMPVYNGENSIREALDSLLAQTFTEFELIISDNSSTDGTEAICREFAGRDSRIRYIRRSENCGPAANFQSVLDEAQAEFFMWAAADDRWDADWMMTLKKGFGPGVSVVFGSSASFRQDYRTGKRTTLRSLTGPMPSRMLTYYLWSEWGTKPIVIYGLYRTQNLRKVTDEVMFRTDGNRWGSDNIVVFKMLQIGCLHIEPAVVLYKRVNQSPEFRPTLHTRFTTWRRFGPFLIEHIQRAPSGVTQCAVAIATPIKYGWLLCRGLRRIAITFKA